MYPLFLLQAVMQLTMILHTERLLLRALLASDLDTIHTLHSMPETDAYNTLGIPETIETTKQLLSEWMDSQLKIPRVSYILAIDHLETNTCIGLIGLNLGKVHYKNAEIWFKIHADYWNKGYTTEAVKALLYVGFNELKLHRIEAGCATENMASIKVLEKVGMTREGLKRKILPIRGTWKDNYWYAILDDDSLPI